MFILPYNGRCSIAETHHRCNGPSPSPMNQEMPQLPPSVVFIRLEFLGCIECVNLVSWVIEERLRSVGWIIEERFRFCSCCTSISRDLCKHLRYTDGPGQESTLLKSLNYPCLSAGLSASIQFPCGPNRHVLHRGRGKVLNTILGS